MTQARTYPHGVPCWVDVSAPDPDAAAAFYGELLGWTIVDAVPEHVPGSYLIASLDGADAAAIAPAEDDGPAEWTTFVAVDDAHAAAARVAELGGTVLSPPQDVGPPGVGAVCADPAGARFALWQAGRRLGAQVANGAGAWTFSTLLAPDFDAARAFYGPLLGWEADPVPVGDDRVGAMWRRPGYGRHLAETVDPGILERQAAVGAPPGFEDVAADFAQADDELSARWRVSFGVADRDAAAATAERLGATVLASEDGDWTRTAVIRDPQGAELVLSQFAPPGS